MKGFEFKDATQPFVALDAATPQLTSRLDSQSIGFTIVLDSHRRASELNRWAVPGRPMYSGGSVFKIEVITECAEWDSDVT